MRDSRFSLFDNLIRQLRRPWVFVFDATRQEKRIQNDTFQLSNAGLEAFNHLPLCRQILATKELAHAKPASLFKLVILDSFSVG